MIKLVGGISYDLGDGDVLSPDVRIDIPKEGIVLKHGDRELCTVAPPDIEIVTDSSGLMLYINLPLTEKNKKWMRDNPFWFTSPD